LTETVAKRESCPYCGNAGFDPWGAELGFFVVRCKSCRFIYLNPMPSDATIDVAVKTGIHNEAHDLDVTSRRIARKVQTYRSVFAQMFADIWSAGKPITWLDIGSGYGEIMEAVCQLAPPDSKISGIEPMAVKAAAARRRGLEVEEAYLTPQHAKVQFVSLVDVFSHIPNFGDLLDTVHAVLDERGELFLETGNLADLTKREEFFGELGLPDHVAFAGEMHIVGYLNRAGFAVVSLERRRIDGMVFFVKNLVKKAIGRKVLIKAPYTSRYRTLLIRARKNGG